MAKKKFAQRETPFEEGKITAYGGYATRREYEKQKQKNRTIKNAVSVVGLAILLCFAFVGIISLVRGDFLTESGAEGEGGGTIRVPTHSQLNQTAMTAEEIVADTEQYLLTLEGKREDGTTDYATGFVISGDGYAVCASSFAEKTFTEMTAYFIDGMTSSVKIIGEKKDLGICLFSLSDGFFHIPAMGGNASFLKRGETLYAVGAHSNKQFYGTVAKGIVASKGPVVKTGEGDDALNVAMFYLDTDPNPSLYGAPVVDEFGYVVGFATDAVEPYYEGTLAVVPINTLYTVVNDILFLND